VWYILQKSKILIIIIILTTLSACGRKGDPIIPGISPPAPPSNIQGYTKGSSAYLSWEIPTKNMDGSKLKDLSRFTLLRADVRDRETGGCGCAYMKIVMIDVEKPAPAIIKDDRVFFVDTGDDLFPPGLTYKIPYSYKIVVEAKSGLLSPESAEIILIPIMPPDPPVKFQGTAQNGTVILKWEAPKKDIKGFNIYRSKSKGAYPDAPVNKELIKGKVMSFADIGLTPGTYYYIIRATDSPAPPFDEGTASEEIEVKVEK
jgi:hypothetical protein